MSLVVNRAQNLDLTYLQPDTKTFVEVLLITTILQSQTPGTNASDEKALVDIFSKVGDLPELASGLRYFVINVVGKSDIVGSKLEAKSVREGCRLIDRVLRDLETSDVA